MSISSLFNTHDAAVAAAADLKASGFPETFVRIVGPQSAGVSADFLAEHGVNPVRAQSTAEAVQNGRSLVIVETPLGTAKLATFVLNSHQQSNSGVSEVRYEGFVADEKFFFSSRFSLPLLLRNPFPFSSWLGLPLLSRRSQKSGSFGLPFLSKNAFPFSSLFGLKLLSNNQSIFSGLFGFPQLSKNEFPLSSMLGMPLLTRSERKTD